MSEGTKNTRKPFEARVAALLQGARTSRPREVSRTVDRVVRDLKAVIREEVRRGRFPTTEHGRQLAVSDLAIDAMQNEGDAFQDGDELDAPIDWNAYQEATSEIENQLLGWIRDGGLRKAGR